MSSPTTAATKRPRKVNQVAELKKAEADTLNIMFGELLQLSKAVYESPAKEAKVTRSDDPDHSHDIHVKPADLKALLKSIKKKTYEVAKPVARVKSTAPRVDVPIYINGAAQTFLESVIDSAEALGPHTAEIKDLLAASVADGVTSRVVFNTLFRLYCVVNNLYNVRDGKRKGNSFHFDNFLSQVFGDMTSNGGVNIGYVYASNTVKSKVRNTDQQISTVQYLNSIEGKGVDVENDVNNFTASRLLTFNSISLVEVQQGENFLEPQAVVDRFGTDSAHLKTLIAAHKAELHQAKLQIMAFYRELKPSPVKKAKK